MKKVGLIILYVLGGILCLGGIIYLVSFLLLSSTSCDNNNPEIIDDCVTVDGEDSCAVDIDEPVVEEPEIVDEPDYGADYHKNLRNQKNIYFLNIDYQIKSGDNYVMKHYEIPSSYSPIYLNSFSKENVWIAKMQGTVLLTGYLENRMVPEGFMYETKEEMEAAPKVENWYIKYYSDGDTNPKSINLGYMRENVFPGWESFRNDKRDGAAIIAVGYYPYYSSRVDRITQVNGGWSGNNYDINLYDFVNDGNVHTFRLMLNRLPFEGDTSYAESIVTERDFIE